MTSENGGSNPSLGENDYSQKSMLLSLPFELIHCIAQCLDHKDLCRLECSSKDFSAASESGSACLLKDSLWRQRYYEDWKNYPRYRLKTKEDDVIQAFSMSVAPTRLRNHPNGDCGHCNRRRWKEMYRWTHQDIKRENLWEEELEGLQWYFNFTPGAGGRGRDTLQKCAFFRGFVFVSGYPPLPYRLVPPSPISAVVAFREEQHSRYFRRENSGGHEQSVIIANFPAHHVNRLHDDGEWLIINDNVTFVSCDPEGTLGYRDRGFQA